MGTNHTAFIEILNSVHWCSVAHWNLGKSYDLAEAVHSVQTGTPWPINVSDYVLMETEDMLYKVCLDGGSLAKLFFNNKELFDKNYLYKSLKYACLAFPIDMVRLLFCQDQ